MKNECPGIGEEDDEMEEQEIILRVPRIRMHGAVPSLPPCAQYSAAV
jgi:hypothetical protein